MILLVILIASAYAATIDLPKDIQFSWTISGDSISFEFTFPASLTEEFGYTGVGFKLPEEGNGMINADINYLLIQTNEIQDRWCYITEAEPAIDSSNDLYDFSYQEDDTQKTYYWSRKLDTGDPLDKVLVEGESYSLLWAIGGITEDGTPFHHHRKDKKRYEITLDNDFSLEITEFLSIMD